MKRRDINDLPVWLIEHAEFFLDSRENPQKVSRWLADNPRQRNEIEKFSNGLRKNVDAPAQQTKVVDEFLSSYFALCDALGADQLYAPEYLIQVVYKNADPGNPEHADLFSQAKILQQRLLTLQDNSAPLTKYLKENLAKLKKPTEAYSKYLEKLADEKQKDVESAQAEKNKTSAQSSIPDKDQFINSSKLFAVEQVIPFTEEDRYGYQDQLEDLHILMREISQPNSIYHELIVPELKQLPDYVDTIQDAKLVLDAIEALDQRFEREYNGLLHLKKILELPYLKQELSEDDYTHVVNVVAMLPSKERPQDTDLFLEKVKQIHNLYQLASREIKSENYPVVDAIEQLMQRILKSYKEQGAMTEAMQALYQRSYNALSSAPLVIKNLDDLLAVHRAYNKSFQTQQNAPEGGVEVPYFAQHKLMRAELEAIKQEIARGNSGVITDALNAQQKQSIAALLENLPVRLEDDPKALDVTRELYQKVVDRYQQIAGNMWQQVGQLCQSIEKTPALAQDQELAQFLQRVNDVSGFEQNLKGALAMMKLYQQEYQPAAQRAQQLAPKMALQWVSHGVKEASKSIDRDAANTQNPESPKGIGND